MKLLFLGTGTSHGVPAIDCMLNNFARCPKGVCAAAFSDARHNRTRCSIVVEYDGKSVLIDVSPDFRHQVLREKVMRIDAVLITHCHADHIGGIPDIRSYTHRPLPFFASRESAARIRQAFDYVFNPPEMRGGGIPDIDLHEIDAPFELFGAAVTPIAVEHGSLKGAYGYRIGELAYVPDLKSMSQEGKQKLRGVKCLVVDALRDERPHSTHMILPESIALARELGAQRTYFTHLAHNIHYQLDSAILDDTMAFAYDGLRVEIEG